MSIRLKRMVPMNSGTERIEETAGDEATQSVRAMAGEVTEQLSRFGNNVDSLARIMMQAGLITTPIESIEKASATPEPPRDTALAAVIRDANTDARMSNNRIEELLGTLERELL